MHWRNSGMCRIGEPDSEVHLNLPISLPSHAENVAALTRILHQFKYTTRKQLISLHTRTACQVYSQARQCYDAKQGGMLRLKSTCNANGSSTQQCETGTDIPVELINWGESQVWPLPAATHTHSAKERPSVPTATSSGHCWKHTTLNLWWTSLT